MKPYELFQNYTNDLKLQNLLLIFGILNLVKLQKNSICLKLILILFFFKGTYATCATSSDIVGVHNSSVGPIYQQQALYGYSNYSTWFSVDNTTSCTANNVVVSITSIIKPPAAIDTSFISMNAAQYKINYGTGSIASDQGNWTIILTGQVTTSAGVFSVTLTYIVEINTCPSSTDTIIIQTTSPPKQYYILGDSKLLVYIQHYFSSHFCSENQVITITKPSTSPDTAFIVFNNVTSNFEVGIDTRASIIGNYTINMVFSATNSAGPVTSIVTFELEVNTCLNSNDVFTVTGLNQSVSYLLGDPQYFLTSNFNFTSSHFCKATNFVNTMTIFSQPTGVTVTSWITFTPASIITSWLQSSQSFSGVYIIMISSTTQTKFDNKTGIIYITLTVYAPCNQSNGIINIIGTSPGPQIYTLGTPQASTTILPFTEDSAFCSASDIVYSFAITSKPANITDVTWISFVNTTQIVSWIQSTVGYVGDFNITVTGNITNINGTWSGSTSFILTVIPSCSLSQNSFTITGSYPTAAKTYQLGDVSASTTVSEFTENSIYCYPSDILYSMNVTSVPLGVIDTSWITFNSATIVVSWVKAPIVGFIGDYTITINGNINNVNGVQSGSTSFVLTVTPTCATSVDFINITNGGSPGPKTYQLGAASASTTLTAFTEDSAYCSPSDIVYSMLITPVPLGVIDTSWITFNNATIVVSWVKAPIVGFIGDYTITINGNINNVNGVQSGSTSFVLTVTPTCATSVDFINITNGGSPGPKTYQLGAASASTTLTAFTEDSAYCSPSDIVYSMLLTSVPSGVIDTSWITFNSVTNTVFWNQSLIEYIGDYTITITGSITNQLGTYAGVISILLSVVKYNPLAVCIETPTKINSKQVEHLFAFIGYQTSGNIDYSTFTDTVSESLGVLSYCGNINVTLTYDSSSIGLTLNQGILNFFAPSDPSQFGDYPSTLTASLDNIGIKLDLPLALTALSFVPPIVQNIIYRQGDVKFQTELGQFQLLPKNYTFSGSPLIAYILDPGSQLQSPVNTSSLNLIPSWVSLNGSLFTVETNLDSSVGEYQIVVLQNFVGVEGYAFLDFKLTVISTSIPIFDNDLNEVYYTNCSSQITLPTFSSKLKIEFNCPDQKFIIALGISVNIGSNQCKNGTYLCTAVLTNENNISKSYQLKIIVGNDTNQTSIKFDPNYAAQQQQISKIKNYFPNIQKNKFTWQSPDFDTIKIVSISHSGLVTFRFNSKILVPKFGQINETGIQLTDYINQTHISLKRIDMNEVKIIQLSNWTTKSLTETEMKIQIYFDKPLEVSKMTPDLLNATFLDNQLFILQDGQVFLFNQEDITIDRNFRIPTQFASEEQAIEAKQLTDAITNSSPSVIVVSLIIQFFAKKLISQVWIFFFALQLIIYINKDVNTSLPASAMITFECIDGILTLNAIKKNAIVDFLGLQKIKDSVFFQSLGVLALLIIIIVLMVTLVVIFYKFCKGKPKQICLQLKDMLFWNFLIRYFYAAFINFTSASLTTLTSSNAGTTELISSSLILSIQVGIICLFIYVLMQGHPINLKTPSSKKKFGFLYNQLDPMIPQKRVYFLMFFAQRIPIICLIVSKTSYGLQQALIQLILLAHTIYLLHFQPYENPEDLVQDLINEIFLMTVHALQLSISPWLTDGNLTSDLGSSVTYIIAFFFAINFGIIITKIILEQLRKQQLKFKKKRMHKQMHAKMSQNRLDQIEQLKELAIQSKKVQNGRVDDLLDFRPHIDDIDFGKIHSSNKLFREIKQMKAIRKKLIQPIQQTKKVENQIQTKKINSEVIQLNKQTPYEMKIDEDYDDQSLFNVSAINFNSITKQNHLKQTPLERFLEGRDLKPYQFEGTAKSQKKVDIGLKYNIAENKKKDSKQPFVDKSHLDLFNVQATKQTEYPEWLFN